MRLATWVVAVALAAGSIGGLRPVPVAASPLPACRISVTAVFPSSSGVTFAIALRRDDAAGPVPGGTVRLFHGLTPFDVTFGPVDAAGPSADLAAATPIVARVPLAVDGAYVSSVGAESCPPYRPWTSARQQAADVDPFVAKIPSSAPIDAKPGAQLACSTPDVAVSEAEHIIPDVAKIAANYGQRSVKTSVEVLVGPDGRAIDAQIAPGTTVGEELGRAAIEAARRSRYHPTRFRCVAAIDDFTQVYEFVGR